MSSVRWSHLVVEVVVVVLVFGLKVFLPWHHPVFIHTALSVVKDLLDLDMADRHFLSFRHPLVFNYSSLVPGLYEVVHKEITDLLFTLLVSFLVFHLGFAEFLLVGPEGELFVGEIELIRQIISYVVFI